MSAQSEEHLIRVYCPTHKTALPPMQAAAYISCPNGPHALAQNFPHDDFWEYCCDCQSFRPSEIRLMGKTQARCLVCDRQVARRYLCNRCQVISIESDEVARRRKAYSINGVGVIEPSCPACGHRPATAEVRAHQCADVDALLLTPRLTCPFCAEPTRVEIQPEAAAPVVQASTYAAQTVAAETAAVQAKPQTQPCPHCGAAMRLNQQFCGQCGGALSTAAQPQEPPLPPPVEPDWARHEASSSSAGPEVAPQVVAPGASSGRGAAVAVVAGIIGLLVLVGIAVSVSHSSNSNSSYAAETTEGKLTNAIAQNNLITPSGASAYDYYQQLKREGASTSKLTGYTEQLLPKLTDRPQSLLNNLYEPGGTDGDISDWQEAAKLLAWASELKPNDTTLAAQAMYCAGRVAFLSKSYDEALRKLQSARDLDRSWPVPLNNLGLVYSDMKQYDTARTYFNEAVKLDPQWAVPYNNLGSSYMRSNDLTTAVGYYNEAVQHAPRWGRPHAWLGDIAMKQNNYQRAADEYKAALDLIPPGTPGWDLGKMQQKYEEALAKAQQGGYSH
ncbi:MAG: hypothetical protein DMF64_05925 [Acidobacteria bacterium]|nr:MAG: hypothetical protein DMF64_05925 [Acidobacteriota bacterium]